MHQRHPRLALPCLLILLLLLTLVPTAPAAARPVGRAPGQELTAAEAVPSGGSFNRGDSPTGLWIVRLADPPVATYDGRVQGFEATQADTQSGEQLDAESQEAQAYDGYLREQQADVQAELASEIGREPVVAHAYTLAFNGFAAELSPEEAEAASHMAGVASVQPDFLREPQTDAGPDWIDALSYEGAAGAEVVTAEPEIGTLGEGIVAGIIDSGIDPDNPSFADTVAPAQGGDGYDHTNPNGPGAYYGVCDPTPNPADPSQAVNNAHDPAIGCNDKLIGAWNFVPAAPMLPASARDDDGHGSHTGSTTAGNQVEVTVSSPDGATSDTVTISGVAPHANIVAYRVCGLAFNGSCGGAAIVAAINQAIADGVDTLNYSIGSTSPGDPWEDADALAFLNARAAGIFVANSAGNAGPAPGTIGSPSGTPWMTTVGASEHNRSYAQTLTLTGGSAPIGPLEGKGFSGALATPTEIVYAGDVNDNNLCIAEDFPAGTDFTGQVVICDRGVTGRVQKSDVVATLGAEGFVLANDAPSAASLNSDAYAVPGVHLTFEDGQDLLAWLDAGTGHQASISATTRDTTSPFSDMQASFSSRSPNGNADTIAPDVTAPGVDIIAALVDESAPGAFTHGFLSGTSMSSPHVAGSGTLLSGLSGAARAWSPAEIESALMTTARLEDRDGGPLLREDNATPATPFDHGAGYVDIDAAAQAGFVLDVTQAEYLAADPDDGGDPTQINKASLSDSQCLQACAWTRTIESTLAAAAEWTVSVVNPAGVVLSVTPSTFTLQPFAEGADSDEQVLTITADVSGAELEEQLFGRIVLTPTGAPGVPEAHFPVALIPSAGIFPDAVEIETRRDAGSQLVEDLATGEYDVLTSATNGLAISDLFEEELPVDPTNANPYDNPTGTFTTTVEVPAGATRLVAEILASQSPDLDLFMGSGETPSAATELCVSASGTALEYCELPDGDTDLEAGTYWVLVQNWDDSAPGAIDAFTLAVGVVDEDEGTLSVEGPASTVAAEPFDVRVFWDEPAMEAGDRLYGSFTLIGDGDPIATVNVNLSRLDDDVTKTADDQVAQPGQTVTYTLTVEGNVTPEDLAYTITDTIPDGMTYVPGSVTGEDATESGGVITWTPTLLSPVGVEGSYTIATNVTDPAACAVPFGDGTYVDFREVGTSGFFPDSGITGDTEVFTVGGGAPFEYSGAAYGEVSFSDDGFLIYDAGSNYGGMPWIPQAVPSPALPSNLLALLWDDYQIAYDPAADDAGVTLLNLGGTGPASALVIDYRNLPPFFDTAPPNYGEAVTMQVWAFRTAVDGPGLYEFYVAFGDLNSLTNNVTAGWENAAGTAGGALVNNAPAASLTTDTVICYDYVGPDLGAQTITYQATVDADQTDGSVLINQVVHNTDNPGSQPATTSDAVLVAPDPVVTVEATVPFADGVVGEFTFTRDEPFGELTVDYTVSGNATPGVHYQALPGSVTFPDGESQVQVPVVAGPGTTRVNRDVVVTVTDGELYDRGVPASARVTIVGTPPLVSVTATTPTATTATDGVLTLSRTDPAGSLTVDYSVTGTAEPDVDYEPLSGSVTFPSGQSTATVAVALTDPPPAPEDPQPTVVLTVLPGADYDVGSPASATVAIAGSEPEPPPPPPPPPGGGGGGGTPGGVPSVSVTADGSTFTFTANDAVAADLTVAYEVGGTAVASEDYTALDGIVTIPAGSASATETVEELAGAAAGATVTVTVVDGESYNVGSPEIATVTLTGDGGEPVPPPPPSPPSPPPPPPGDAEGEVERLFGPTRIETGVAVSQSLFGDDEAGAVVLARADIPFDALAGTPLAAGNDAPMLLTDSAALHPATAAEIDRVLPAGGTVYLLGGEAALEAGVETALAAAGYVVERLSGPTRIETALAVAEEIGEPGAILIATSEQFPDALAAGAAADEAGGLVLLTPGGVAHPDVQAYLDARPDTPVWAAGGPAAAAFPTATPVVGVGREATARLLAEEFFTAPTLLGVARGDDFPDALTGGTHAAILGGPVLLTPPDSLGTELAAYACANAASLDQGFVYGGNAAVNADVLAAIADRVNGVGC